jgi:hypothetical protein
VSVGRSQRDKHDVSLFFFFFFFFLDVCFIQKGKGRFHEADNQKTTRPTSCVSWHEEYLMLTPLVLYSREASGMSGFWEGESWS